MPGKVFHCIAVDMGAGSIRVMLGTLLETSITYREVYRHENGVVYQDGHDRWDMVAILDGIASGIRSALREVPGVESIGVDSWGVDYVLLDEEGELVETPIAYRDRRTEGLREEWSVLVSEEETFRRTGINFYVFNTLFQIMAHRKESAWERAQRILFMPSYISYMISGNAFNELCISSTSQMLGIGGTDWDELILDKLELDADRLGLIVAPGTVTGSMHWPEVREDIRNVAVCGHDTACVVAALPVEREDFAYISAGTWCIVGMESEHPVTSSIALKEGFTNERGYGNTYRILKNILGLWLIQKLRKEMPGKPGFAELERLAYGAGDTSQLIEPDDPRFYHPQSMRSAFDSYFDESGQERPGEWGIYLRCAYDSLCFSFRYHLEQLEALSGRRIGLLHMVGGGSQSDYLNQRTADICERTLISGPVEGAVLGNVLIQALALGKIDSLEEGRSLVRSSFPGKQYTPGGLDRKSRMRYEQFLEYKTKKKALQ